MIQDGLSTISNTSACLHTLYMNKHTNSTTYAPAEIWKQESLYFQHRLCADISCYGVLQLSSFSSHIYYM